jgi:modulator of FtsH protease HflC
MRALWPLILFAAAVLVVLLNTLFVVRQQEQALVLRFGERTYWINVEGVPGARPGLYAKIPFVDTVVRYDKRNMGLTIQGQSIVAADQERLIVDAMLRWKIVQPLRFYQAAQTTEGGAQRLQTRMESALRRALGSATSNDIISGRRAQLMQVIEDDLNATALAELGVRIADVRIRQADLPPQTQQRVYQRMRSDREQVAARIRAEGGERALTIRAEGDRQVVEIKAGAQEQSEKLRGQGEAERARIFAAAYGRDPEFAEFYRSMLAYQKALDAGTPIVVPTDSDFFRYMQNRNGRR